MKILNAIVCSLIILSFALAIVLDPMHTNEIELTITNGTNQTCKVTNLTNVYKKHYDNHGYAQETDSDFIGVKTKTDDEFIFNFGDGSGYHYYIGHALYKIEIGTEFFKLDYRDCQYSEPYETGEQLYRTYDVYMKFDPTKASGQKFSILNASTNQFETITSGSTVGVWKGGRKYSPEVINTCFGNPSVPSNFRSEQVSAGGGSYHPKLIWNQNTDYDIDGYQLWRKLHGGNWGVIANMDHPTTSFIDGAVIIQSPNRKNVSYKVKAIDWGPLYSGFSNVRVISYNSEAYKIGEYSNGDKTVVSIETVHTQFSLFQNNPNPFNPSTTISFALSEPCNVNLIIYDIMGNKINQIFLDDLASGRHQLRWNGEKPNGESVASGIYIYKLKAIALKNGKVYSENKKMHYMR